MSECTGLYGIGLSGYILISNLVRLIQGVGESEWIQL